MQLLPPQNFPFHPMTFVFIPLNLTKIERKAVLPFQTLGWWWYWGYVSDGIMLMLARYPKGWRSTEQSCRADWRDKPPPPLLLLLLLRLDSWLTTSKVTWFKSAFLVCLTLKKTFFWGCVWYAKHEGTDGGCQWNYASQNKVQMFRAKTRDCARGAFCISLPLHRLFVNCA